jgi:hypothetical protein
MNIYLISIYLPRADSRPAIVFVWSARCWAKSSAAALSVWDAAVHVSTVTATWRTFLELVPTKENSVWHATTRISVVTAIWRQYLQLRPSIAAHSVWHAECCVWAITAIWRPFFEATWVSVVTGDLWSGSLWLLSLGGMGERLKMTAGVRLLSERTIRMMAPSSSPPSPPSRSMQMQVTPGPAQLDVCGQILSHCLGDFVDYGVGLSYRPARLHRLAGRYDNDNIPQSGTKNFASDQM